jgi:hypothetical protein
VILVTDPVAARRGTRSCGGDDVRIGCADSDRANRGNDNDDDRTRYEPHYREITRPDQIQIYESILREPSGAVTTGLLSSTGDLKDNRLTPRGFDKATTGPDFASSVRR